MQEAIVDVPGSSLVFLIVSCHTSNSLDSKKLGFA